MIGLKFEYEKETGEDEHRPSFRRTINGEDRTGKD